MQQKISAKTQSDYFELKKTPVDLVPQASGSEGAFLSLEDLESIRLRGRAISASKHALETICGASCETGAM